MTGPSPSDARKLLETVSFELDTNLRLHPQKLNLGKTELLTDAVTLPFVDIEKRLSSYVTSSSPQETEELRRGMKAYLARLNSNPLLPLHFRLKVLQRFQRELVLFDTELTAAILNAHKLAVEMVQKAAKTQTHLYRILVSMVADALEVAEQVLRQGLKNHRPQAVIAVRQVMDISRLGLAVVPLLPDNAMGERVRLYRCVSLYEMVRKLDFFSKSGSEQRMIMKELEHHIGALKPILWRKNDPAPQISDNSLLLTFMARPHDAPIVASSLPTESPSDLIIIPLDKFLDRLVTAVNRMETVLNNSEMQKHDLHTEEELQATIRGGSAILDALHHRKRATSRKELPGAKAAIEWRADKAILDAYSILNFSDYEYAPHESLLAEAWSLVDISDSGVQLERVSFQMPTMEIVDRIIGLYWMPMMDAKRLGYVRWVKEIKPGEHRMGVEFFRPHVHLGKGALLGYADPREARHWPLLLERRKDGLNIWFPDLRIMKGSTFSLTLKDGDPIHLKVSEVLHTGANYIQCLAVHAESK
ncbi:MAG: hypothetical protein R8K46_06585 [Mariprofundaceae bacterium]